MNKTLSKQIQALMDCEDQPCVTLVLGTQNAPFERAVILARYKKQMRDLKDQLKERGTAPLVADKILEKLEALALDQDFWLRLKESIVVYGSPDAFETFRLHTPLKDALHVSDRFLTKYILPSLFEEERFHILLIRNNSVHLYTAQDHGLVERTEVHIPQNLGEVTEHKGLKYRQQGHSSASKSGKSTGYRGFFSGVGEDMDGKQEDIIRFYNAIDEKVMEILKDQNEPLVLAGVESLMQTYKHQSDYPKVLDAILRKDLSPDDQNGLYTEASQLVASEIQSKRDFAINFISENEQKKHQLVTLKLEKIREAADTDNIDTLMIWMEETLSDESDDDIIESLVRLVYPKRGKIYHWFQTAAILRHP